LAADVTERVHGKKALENALETTDILFGKGTAESLKKLSPDNLLSDFEGVPQFRIDKIEIEAGINIGDLLAVNTTIFPSKGEMRKMIQNGGLSLNKEKVADAGMMVNDGHLISNRFILVQKGKKDYYLILAE
jgi:tyrosyl-tRNA synthetase